MLRRGAVALLRRGLRQAAEESAASWSAAKAVQGSRPPVMQQARQQWTDRRGYEHFGGRGGYAVMQPQTSRRTVTWVVVLGAGGGVVWYSGRQEVPYTGRWHSILISPEAEKEMGAEAFQQVVQEAKANGTLLSQHHPATKSVRRVGMRIAQSAADGFGGGYQDHLKGLNWEFAVINSDQVNAFVVPGGHVVVYTGLLRLIRNEDELASVLAHECAHVVARHAAERITQMGALELARLIAYWGFGLPIPRGPLTAIFFLPNSRKQETEADVIGVQVMSRACYAPEGMITMFQKLEAAEGKEANLIPNFLRTHPHSKDRVEAIRKMLPHAEGLYEMSGCEGKRGPMFSLRQALFRRVDW